MRIEEFEDDDLMNELESRGYDLDIRDRYGVRDYIDSTDLLKLDEIVKKFLNASWSEREKIYNLIAGK